MSSPAHSAHLEEHSPVVANTHFKRMLKTIVTHPNFHYISSFALVGAYLFFLYNHVISIRAGEISPAILIFVVMETLVIYLILTRPRPSIRSTELAPIAVALIATFLPTIFIPTGYALNETVGNILMIIGGTFACGAYLSLNKSLGITPALREVKTSGLYHLVRHPMYLSYVFIYIGYLNLAFSLYNLAMIAILIVCLLLRIHYEEILLTQDKNYVEYKKRVKYRLLPFIY